MLEVAAVIFCSERLIWQAYGAFSVCEELHLDVCACPSQIRAILAQGKGEMSVASVLLLSEWQKVACLNGQQVNPFPAVEGHGPAGSDAAGFSKTWLYARSNGAGSCGSFPSIYLNCIPAREALGCRVRMAGPCG